MKREAGDYIADIIDAIDKANKFIGNMSFDEFILDEKTIFAVIRALEIVGEAAKNIPWELRETIKEEIPPLKPEFEKILRGL